MRLDKSHHYQRENLRLYITQRNQKGFATTDYCYSSFQPSVIVMVSFLKAVAARQPYQILLLTDKSIYTPLLPSGNGASSWTNSV